LLQTEHSRSWASGPAQRCQQLRILIDRTQNVNASRCADSSDAGSFFVLQSTRHRLGKTAQGFLMGFGICDL